MRERSDPLVPVLASAVAVVVVGAIAFIFYPKLSRLLENRAESVVGRPPSPSARVPVWVGHTEDQVAFVLATRGEDGRDAVLDGALDGGPYRYLTLTVYNFGRDEPYRLVVPKAGYASPEGGPRVLPAAELLVDDLPRHLETVLRGYGAVPGLTVAKGRSGQVLLVSSGDPARRTSFFIDEAVRLERRELERRVLASWQQRPDWKGFGDLY